MPTVNLDDKEWQQVLAILGGTRDFPWNITNPLLMKIGGQLSAVEAGRTALGNQATKQPSNIAPIGPPKRGGNKEIRHE